MSYVEDEKCLRYIVTQKFVKFLIFDLSLLDIITIIIMKKRRMYECFVMYKNLIF